MAARPGFLPSRSGRCEEVAEAPSQKTPPRSHRLPRSALARPAAALSLLATGRLLSHQRPHRPPWLCHKHLCLALGTKPLRKEEPKCLGGVSLATMMRDAPAGPVGAMGTEGTRGRPREPGERRRRRPAWAAAPSCPSPPPAPGGPALAAARPSVAASGPAARGAGERPAEARPVPGGLPGPAPLLGSAACVGSGGSCGDSSGPPHAWSCWPRAGCGGDGGTRSGSPTAMGRRPEGPGLTLAGAGTQADASQPDSPRPWASPVPEPGRGRGGGRAGSAWGFGPADAGQDGRPGSSTVASGPLALQPPAAPCSLAQAWMGATAPKPREQPLRPSHGRAAWSSPCRPRAVRRLAPPHLCRASGLQGCARPQATPFSRAGTSFAQPGAFYLCVLTWAFWKQGGGGFQRRWGSCDPSTRGSPSPFTAEGDQVALAAGRVTAWQGWRWHCPLPGELVALGEDAACPCSLLPPSLTHTTQTIILYGRGRARALAMLPGQPCVPGLLAR